MSFIAYGYFELSFLIHSKGTAFTVKERQLMGIHGLIPPVVRTMEEQTVRVLTNFHKRSSDLDRFIYLISLQDRNERLFYKVTVDLNLRINIGLNGLCQKVKIYLLKLAEFNARSLYQEAL